jgi:hypothetical protein
MAGGLHLRRRRSSAPRKPKRHGLYCGGRDSSKEMFGHLLVAPLGNALTPETFVAPSPVLLRQVFTTDVCVKMFGEELGPGNELCEEWNQPVALETPCLEPPVGRTSPRVHR